MNKMKRKAIMFVHTTIVVVMGSLLLVGCQNSKDQKKAAPTDCVVPRNDEMNEDSIQKYYERMELWEALHEGMSMADK